MSKMPYSPIFELTRGETVESIHYGSVAVVDAHGQLITEFGDPYTITFLRSTAKPFQALPFIEHGGHERYGLTHREIALICASHSGTDAHVAVVQSIQRKSSVSEADLLCGVHPPSHEATAEAMRQRGELPTPNRHNCSGKHTGMVAYARLEELPTEDYINPSHPIQKIILNTFAEMCNLPPEGVALGTDGCSAPNFAVPLYNAALAYARLCDPAAGNVTPPARAEACRTITTAMSTNPDMVGGPGRFDTRLMEVAQGRIISKSGAEGYQGIGLLPGTLGPNSPALGIAFKISDGDLKKRARPAVALEILRQLGVLTDNEIGTLAEFGPSFPIYNWRKLVIGQAYPSLELKFRP